MRNLAPCTGRGRGRLRHDRPSTGPAFTRPSITMTPDAAPAKPAEPPATTAASPATAAARRSAAAHPPQQRPAAAPAGPPPAVPFSKAVLAAANALFGKADLSNAATIRSNAMPYPLVIDPLVDGNSGYQSEATRAMEKQIVELLKTGYPNYDVRPFTTSNLARGPLLFIGTFTAVDKERKNVGEHDAYRICLALVDLRSGKILSKGLAFAEKDGVDIAPIAFYQDSPGWAPDPAIQGYVRTCQGTKAGDPINPVYWDRIVQAALINDATIAYGERNYETSLDLFRAVLRQPGGDQLRVYNGIYLAANKLGRKDEAAQAFARVVDFGLTNNQLGVMFTFRPSSTLFPPDPKVSGDYHMWIGADRAARLAAQRLPRGRRAQQQDRARAAQPAPVADACAVHQAAHRHRGTDAGQAHQRDRQGLERDQDRHRHRRPARPARPARRVQGARLPAHVAALQTRRRAGFRWRDESEGAPSFVAR